MKAVMISLKGPHERRHFQTHQCAALGLDITWLDATTPDDLPQEQLDHLRLAWARPLRDGEVALTDSHRRAWQICVEQNAPLAVFEDDVLLAHDIVAVLDELEQGPQRGLVNLETFTKEKLLGRSKSFLGLSGYHLTPLYHDKGGAAAYVVWPDAARVLLAATQSHYPIADAAINLARGLERHQLLPAAAIQAMFETNATGAKGAVARHIAPSIVGQAARPPYPSLAVYLTCKLRRARISLWLSARKLQVGRKARPHCPAPPKTDANLFGTFALSNEG